MLFTEVSVLLLMLFVEVPPEPVKRRLLLFTGMAFSDHWAAVFQEPVAVFQVEVPSEPE